LNNKITIGGAQFGLNYGIGNSTSKLSRQDIRMIFDRALEVGVDSIDTAINYKKSELIIGENHKNNFKIITKLPRIPNNINDSNEWVNSHIMASFKRLNVKKIYAVLLHNPLDLLSNKNLYNSLILLKKNNLVEKIGISIYSPLELEKLIGEFSLDLIQSPLNIIDRRLEESGWLDKLFDLKIEVHTRSCFLQGLLLMKKNKRPRYFNKWSTIFERWDDWLLDTKCNPISACLALPILSNKINRTIIGTDNIHQFNEIIIACKNLHGINLPNLSSSDTSLVNPSLWDIQ